MAASANGVALDAEEDPNEAVAEEAVAEETLGSPVVHPFPFLRVQGFLESNQPQKGCPYYDMVAGLLRTVAEEAQDTLGT